MKSSNATHDCFAGEEAYIEKNLKNGKRNSQNDKHNKDGNLMKKIASDDEVQRNVIEILWAIFST